MGKHVIGRVSSRIRARHCSRTFRTMSESEIKTASGNSNAPDLNKSLQSGPSSLKIRGASASFSCQCGNSLPIADEENIIVVTRLTHSPVPPVEDEDQDEHEKDVENGEGDESKVGTNCSNGFA